MILLSLGAFSSVEFLTGRTAVNLRHAEYKARALILSPSFAFDSTFYEWLNKIPALDSEDLRR
jgi:hypothetical protein